MIILLFVWRRKRKMHGSSSGFVTERNLSSNFNLHTQSSLSAQGTQGTNLTSNRSPGGYSSSRGEEILRSGVAWPDLSWNFMRSGSRVRGTFSPFSKALAHQFKLDHKTIFSRCNQCYNPGYRFCRLPQLFSFQVCHVIAIPFAE